MHNPLILPCVAVARHRTNMRAPTSNATFRRSWFSDHIPIRLCFSVKIYSEKPSRSIPKWVAKSFAAKFRELWIPARTKCPYRRLQTFKDTMFKAAKATIQEKGKQGTAILNYSHLLNLSRLVLCINQDTQRILRSLNRDPTLEPLVTIRGGRYCDNGLERAAQELALERGSASMEKRKNAISDIKGSAEFTQRHPSSSCKP